jgi:mRNA-degrading endonuclease RelE of RelBE toxin-antitoxin system
VRFLTSQNSSKKALTPQIASQPGKYLESLDAQLRKRIVQKIADIALDPRNIRISKPLKGSDKWSSRVGSYRILYMVVGNILLVSDIGPRGKVYQKA